jgi:hypothetical protein
MESADVAGGLAHDVNNIPFAIGGHAYLMRAQNAMPPDARRGAGPDRRRDRARAKPDDQAPDVRAGGSTERHRVQVNEIVTETLEMLGSLGAESRSRRRSDPDLPRFSPTRRSPADPDELL